MQRAVNAPGFMLAQLNGSVAGQTVPHYHLHIILRQDALEMALHARDMADMDALSELAEDTRRAVTCLYAHRTLTDSG